MTVIMTNTDFDNYLALLGHIACIVWMQPTASATDRVAWFVCVSVTTVSPAKMAQQILMLFGGLKWAKEPHIRWGCMLTPPGNATAGRCINSHTSTAEQQQKATV